MAAGTARILGDDINTDYIVPSHRKKETIDPQILRAFVFEDIHPGFHDRMDADTILVAGSNFGCGSAMEVAVTVLQAAGVRAVVAKSFSRTFRRNALNNGLLLCQADFAHLQEGAHVVIKHVEGRLTIQSDSAAKIDVGALPPFMVEILSHDGLTDFLKAKGGFF